MIIADIYIKEAVRIRKTYIDNLMYIVENEEEIVKYKEEIEQIGKDVNIVSKKSADDPEYKKFLNEKLNDLEINIEKAKKKILPYYDKIIKIQKDTENLWNSIKEKYPEITKEELQEQIIPYIKDIKI